MSDLQTISVTRCSLLRRLGVMLYDGFLAFAVVALAATLPTMLFSSGSGDDLKPFYEGMPVVRALFFLYLIAALALFFIWFWTHGGQTLGMKTWRVKLTALDGGSVTLRQGLIRFTVSLLSWLPAGLGYLWSLWDRDGLAWHDRASATRLVVLPKK